ncbi:MAG TPA: hypothetical protein VGH19_16965 [Verrucomicrobiae bacterium]
MKSNLLQTAWKLAAIVAVISAPLVAGAAAAPAKPAPAKDPEPKKSVFATDPKAGKDPFFPKSERWNPPPKVVAPVVTPTPGGTSPVPPPVVKKDPYKNFELKGFVGVGNNRVVTISSGLKNYIVGLGESKLASTPDGPVRFKVVRFSDTGVFILVEGEKQEKELSLPTP